MDTTGSCAAALCRSSSPLHSLSRHAQLVCAAAQSQQMFDGACHAVLQPKGKHTTFGEVC